MNKIVTILVLGCLVSACAEKNPNYDSNPISKLQELEKKKLSELSKLSPKKDEISLIDKINKLKPQNLEIKYPNNDKKAQIIIEGMEAKILYDNLSVNYDVTLKKDSASTSTKNGMQITCINNAIPNKKNTYKCLMEVNYSTGTIADVQKFSSDSCFNHSISSNTYLSKLLRIDTSGQAKIKLTQYSAEVLYSLLEISEVNNEKVGHDYSCIKKIDKNHKQTHFCTLKIDTFYGQILH